MNDEDVTARLARWRPARPASELMRQLHAAVPPARVRQRLWRSAAESFGTWLWRPWPLAHAGLLAAWMLILALRLSTPSNPEPASTMVIAQTDVAPNEAPALASTLATEGTFLVTRKNLDQL